MKNLRNALVVEFGSQNLSFVQLPEFPVTYKSANVRKYMPGLICFDAVVVNTRTVERISNDEVGQMLNDLKVTEKHFGMVIDFKNARVEFKRVLRSTQKPK